LANYNGSIDTIFVKGGNQALTDNIDSEYWVFAGNTWTVYSSPNNEFSAGTWKILPDSTLETIENDSLSPGTSKIIRITPDTLITDIPYDHNDPGYPSVQTVIVAGLDTAKLSAYILIFTTTP
jgi:hypothetical protein